MKINPINEYRVEVELAPAELEALGVRFETLDWADVETRRAVWSVLGRVREQGVELAPEGRLLIEAGRVPQGVRLCFTSVPGKGAKRPAPRFIKEDCLVLRCESQRDLQRAAALLPGAELSAYRRGEVYFLLASGQAPCSPGRAAEFGAPVPGAGPLARAILEEYAFPLPL